MKHPIFRSRIVIVLLVVSLLPLCLMSAGSWFVFGRLLDKKSLELQRTVVESHARSIEAYLTESLNSLRLLATTHGFDEITDQKTLHRLFTSLNMNSNDGFIDLGVIGADGEHLAYIGPYDLINRNYRDTDWFKQVTNEGKYISDVFLGFRQVPHCVIAVKSYHGTNPWFLRATINSDQFDALVQTGMLGETGDAFIINIKGFYQTTPRVGLVLDKSPLTNLEYHRDVQDRIVRINGPQIIQVTTWINENRWMLVVQQDAAEIRAPVTRAAASGALLILLAIVLIVITTYLATRHLLKRIDKANAQREEMFKAFTRSAKLASVGELATGLAHEINNPLAILSADQTNISDIISEIKPDKEYLDELSEALARGKKQIQRCKSITTKMLQFGRKRDTQLEPTDLAPSVREINKLLERQASVNNVELILETEENLPTVMIDPVELEQVLVNLINNSMHALDNGGKIATDIRSEGDEVILEVKDNGSGISQEDLNRIFEPFFTTKPVGKGTGLGLSVCYGIVQSWGGRLEAESKLGKGTTMRIHLPVNS
ncbi:MAG: ATP-binding protein [Candidatus Hatepunaea meridiana]|nr:ATP-binding protein [Candidatus Hatepunaea meridiana]